MKKEWGFYTLPEWLLYTCSFVFAGGITQMFFGNLTWETLESKTAIIITFVSLLVLFFSKID